MARASIFYARNIDQLLLALLGRLIAFSRAPIAYEVLDIPPILMRRGLVPTFLRAIERLCLRRVSLLVLSSPGFHRNYFSAVQNYARRLVPAGEQALPLAFPFPLGGNQASRNAATGRGWSATSA